MSKKSLFGPLLYDQPIYTTPIKCGRAGGSDLTNFENRVFRPPKMVQNIIFRRSDENKSC